VEGRLDTAIGEAKAYIQRKVKPLNNLNRLLGGRLEKAGTVEVLRTNQVWDMNLIAGRLPENLGVSDYIPANVLDKHWSYFRIPQGHNGTDNGRKGPFRRNTSTVSHRNCLG
jgi:hypothetical protein